MRNLFSLIALLVLLSGAFAGYFGVSHDDTLVAGQENDYLVHVRDKTTREPIAKALVTLVFESKELASFETNDQGYVLFKLLPGKPGRVEFRVTYPEYNDYVIVQSIDPAPVAPKTDENATAGVSADTTEPAKNATTPVTGFVPAFVSDNWLWLFIFGVIVVALAVFGYFMYTRDDTEDIDIGPMSLEERYDFVKSELESI
jgi:hypothetical protein